MAKDHVYGQMPALKRGGYVARVTQSAAELETAQRLRHRCFVDGAGRPAMAGGLDRDGFDDRCTHVLVCDPSGQAVCTFRVLACADAAALRHSYSAQFYDIADLTEGPFLELGRFCVCPDVSDPDVVRLAWGMLARLVDQCGAAMLFGCSSFQGIDPAPYRRAFDLLAAHYVSDKVGAKASDRFDFTAQAQPAFERKVALSEIPPLLRTYLGMGGWVSDHAVIDRDMNTLHVFTGVVIADIPPARAAALRAVAKG